MTGHMFGNYGANWNQGFSPFDNSFGLMHFITWLLVIALLISLIRYFWNKK